MQRQEPSSLGAHSGPAVEESLGRGCCGSLSLLLNKSGPVREEEGKTGDPHSHGTVEAAAAPRCRGETLLVGGRGCSGERWARPGTATTGTRELSESLRGLSTG